MSLFQIITYCLIAVIALSALVVELRRDLTMMQQNSYRPDRYRRWLSQSGDTASVGRLVAIAILFLGMSPFIASANVVMFLILAVTAWWTVKTLNIRYKKPLVMTKRAWRIFSVQMVLSVAVIAIVWWLFAGTFDPARGLELVALGSLGCLCGSHILTMLAVWALTPVEKSINRRFIRDAERRLHDMPRLKVVGITGSYGKTSTKHFLYRILSEEFNTVMTPGSFNTTLGVVRTVRELLKPYTEVFIAEMGAKQPGDIAEICRIVNPEIGILTAVGPAHLESFKTLENIRRTKFELIDSLPKGGIAVVNNDFPAIADTKLPAGVSSKSARYAVTTPEGADVVVSNVAYFHAGTTFTVTDRRTGVAADFATPLVGEGNISNLTAAIITARALGMSDEKIAYAVSMIEPVEHRMSVKRHPGGVTVIDDAFNSNPAGAAMACDVLKAMRPGQRIIVTPGMVELGTEQHTLNAALGERIAASADVAIIVNRLNREALLEGIEKGGMNPEAVHAVDSFAQAQALLQTIMKPGDTVLYENDLPDTFK